MIYYPLSMLVLAGGGGAESPNNKLVDLTCQNTDDAFHRCPDLAAKFLKGPAARGEASAMLKSFAKA